MGKEDDGNGTTPRQEVADEITVSLGAFRNVGEVREAFKEIGEDHARQLQAIEAIAEERRCEWEAIRESILRVALWSEQLRERIQETIPNKAQLQRSVEAQFARAEQLGAEGWTLPMEATHSEIRWILEDSEGDIDDAMAAAFEEWDWLDRIEQNLKTKRILDPWRPLVRECFASYHEGRYVVAVPGLFAVIEGVLVGTVKGLGDNDTSVKRTAGDYLDSFEDQPWQFRRLLAVSVDEFCGCVFDPRPFSDPRPGVINRHRILHGRDRPSEWKGVDALRLFNALDTITTMLGEPEQD